MSNDALSRLDCFLRELPAQKLPPVQDWHPTQCGVIDIRIDRNGDWYHEGEPIRRAALVSLFASILRRDGDGYYLVTPAEKQRIEVEDAPLFVDQLQHEGQGRDQRLLLATRTGDWVPVDDEHPLWVDGADGEPSPYVKVRDRLHARLGRNVFYQLVELAEVGAQDGADYYGVWSNGSFFRLGSVE